MLGNYADGLSAHQPDHISCVPFRVLSIDRSASETELLKAGKLPVTWEQYPYWGQEPAQGVMMMDAVGGDSIVRFPIPGSEAQAARFLAREAAGLVPQVVAVGPSEGTCHNCLRQDCGILWPCAGCKLVKYCSKKCMSKHWELHKQICQAPEKGPQLAQGSKQ